MKSQRRDGSPRLGQGEALGRDGLPPTIIGGVPIDNIHSTGQVAFTERLGQFGGLVERQSPAGIDRQIEIGVAPRTAVALEPNTHAWVFSGKFS